MQLPRRLVRSHRHGLLPYSRTMEPSTTTTVHNSLCQEDKQRTGYSHSTITPMTKSAHSKHSGLNYPVHSSTLYSDKNKAKMVHPIYRGISATSQKKNLTWSSQRSLAGLTLSQPRDHQDKHPTTARKTTTIMNMEDSQREEGTDQIYEISPRRYEMVPQSEESVRNTQNHTFDTTAVSRNSSIWSPKKNQETSHKSGSSGVQQAQEKADEYGNSPLNHNVGYPQDQNGSMDTTDIPPYSLTISTARGLNLHISSNSSIVIHSLSLSKEHS